MIVNKLTSTTVGGWFTHDQDWVGYIPMGLLGFIAGIVSIPIAIEVAVLTAMFYFWIPMVVIFGILSTISFSDYAKAGMTVQKTTKDYWSLTKKEKKLLPPNTDKVLLEVNDNNSEVTKEVRYAINSILDSRKVANKPKMDNFIAHVRATREAIDDTNSLYKEML